MPVKRISSIDKVSKSLKKKGVVVSDEALAVIVDTAFSELMNHIVKLNDTIMGLRNDMSELTKMQSNMEKLLAEKKLADEEIERLKEKLREAEAKNNRDSSNSNKPSSWDHFDKPKPSPKRSAIFSGGDNKKKKSGGQKGHKGTTMKISDRPDEVVDICPGECVCCPRYQECLASSTIKETRSVVDIELNTKQTDYVLRSFRCPNAGRVIVGRFPDTVASRFQYGPMTKAVVTDLSADGAMSMERIRVFMNTLFGFGMSDGTVRNIIGKASKLGESFMEKAKNAVSKCKVVHFDETGGRYKGKNAWFHIAATKLFSLFGFHEKRGDVGIKDMGIYTNMTDPSQVAVTDFWASYRKLDGDHPKRHAFCMAHLDRELQDLIDNHGNPACARKMQKLLKRAYIETQKHKASGKAECEKGILEDISQSYDKIVAAALNRHRPPKQEKKRGRPAKGKIRSLFERFREFKEGVLMFLYDFDVPASNNIAELGAKGLKTKLKVSECFRGTTGPNDFCTVKSILESARKHGLNHLNILKDLFSGKDISLSFSL